MFGFSDLLVAAKQDGKSSNVPTTIASPLHFSDFVDMVPPSPFTITACKNPNTGELMGYQHYGAQPGKERYPAEFLRWQTEYSKDAQVSLHRVMLAEKQKQETISQQQHQLRQALWQAHTQPLPVPAIKISQTTNPMTLSGIAPNMNSVATTSSSFITSGKAATSNILPSQVPTFQFLFSG